MTFLCIAQKKIHVELAIEFSKISSSKKIQKKYIHKNLAFLISNHQLESVTFKNILFDLHDYIHILRVKLMMTLYSMLYCNKNFN